MTTETITYCDNCSQGILPGMEDSLLECSQCGKQVCRGCREVQGTGEIVCDHCTEKEHGDTV